jgi:hypothetical protein
MSIAKHPPEVNTRTIRLSPLVEACAVDNFQDEHIHLRGLSVSVDAEADAITLHERELFHDLIRTGDVEKVRGYAKGSDDIVSLLTGNNFSAVRVAIGLADNRDMMQCFDELSRETEQSEHARMVFAGIRAWGK